MKFEINKILPIGHVCASKNKCFRYLAHHAIATKSLPLHLAFTWPFFSQKVLVISFGIGLWCITLHELGFWNFGLVYRFCCFLKAFVFLTWALFGLLNSSTQTQWADALTKTFDLLKLPLHLSPLRLSLQSGLFCIRSMLDCFFDPPTSCVAHHSFTQLVVQAPHLRY